jgi:protein deglycase
MTRRVLVPISTGFEEIETVTVIDILKRAGAEVVLASLEGDRVAGRSNITLIADMSLDEALASGGYDLIVLPGGLPNAYTLRDDERIIAAVKAQVSAGGKAAAICAAPLALERAGVLCGKQATCHPGMVDELTSATFTEARVAAAGNITTSRSAGTAMEFAFSLVRDLFGEAKVEEVNTGVLARL